jgi:hypothetical protein
MIQLDFFEKDETLILRDQMRQLKESQDKQRKSLFAKNGELQKKYDDLLKRMEILERNICQT